jgi:hypothetical protein
MFRSLRLRTTAPLVAGALIFAGALGAPAQEQRRSRIDVEQVAIDAEISPTAQTLSGKAAIRFVPLDDNISSAAFELNNALNVSRVTDEKGNQIPASRNQQDSTVRLSFDSPLPKGQPVSITFTYDGRLSGQEESPVYGLKFAAIHPDFTYLAYPGRWFPVAGYSVDRFTSDMRITVPAGFTVVGSAPGAPASAGDKTTFNLKYARSSFPGTIAVVKGEPVKVPAEGVTTSLYFRGAEAEMAQAYGQEIGKQMSWFAGTFGAPPSPDLTVVETEEGAPNGYAAPGLLLLSPRGIGKQPNIKLLSNQISRQWWEDLVSPSSRNQLWLTNGPAAYSELLWSEHANGPGALESQLHDVMVEALTIDNVPIIQSARLEDYSPELWALTGRRVRLCSACCGM